MPEPRSALVVGREFVIQHALVFRRQSGEHLAHRSDTRQIRADVVISAALAARQSKRTVRVGIACAGAAEMDQGRELLLLLERCGLDSVPRQCPRDASV